MYRPKNWKKIKDKLTDSVLAMPQEYFQGFDTGIEAGADAILEALKEGGLEVDFDDYGADFDEVACREMCSSKGWLVFIPDKEG